MVELVAQIVLDPDLVIVLAAPRYHDEQMTLPEVICDQAYVIGIVESTGDSCANVLEIV